VLNLCAVGFFPNPDTSNLPFDKMGELTVGWQRGKTRKKTNNQMVVSNAFYFHPEPWGNDPNLTHIFQMGWFNHQLEKTTSFLGGFAT